MSNDPGAKPSDEHDAVSDVHPIASLAETSSTRRTALGLTAAATATILADRAIFAPAPARAEPEIVESVNGKTGKVKDIAEGSTVGVAAGPYSTAQVWSPGAEIDCASRIQEALDKGATRIKLEGEVPFYLNSAVFDDSTVGIAEGGQDRQVVIEGNNQTRLVLGPGLPTTEAFSEDHAVKWAFFPNTKRTALSSGVVTCTEATAVNGKIQNCGPRLVFRLLVIDGKGRNAGLVFGNECSNEIDHCTIRGLKFGQSWTGYCDGAKISNIYQHDDQGASTAGAVSKSWLIYQQTNGDRVCVENIEVGGTHEIGIWNARTCHGGSVQNAVGGAFRFQNCSGIAVDAGHQELTQEEPANPVFEISNTSVTITGFCWNAGQKTGRYFLYLNDSEASYTPSIVKLVNCSPVYFPQEKDSARSPDIYIAAANPNTRLAVDNTHALSIALGTTLHNSCNLIVQSAVAEITEALADSTYPAFNKSTIAAPHWELCREGTTNKAWAVTSPLTGVTSSVFNNTPELGVAATSEWEGTLTEGTKYAYAIALKQTLGRHSMHTAASETSAGAAGAIYLNVTLHATPTSIVVWRKAGGNPLTEPEAYAVIPASSVKMRLVDTGAHINGVAWVSTEVPVPNTSYTNNTMCNGIKLPGGTELLSGEGTPDTRGIIAPVGSLYLDTETGVGNQLWIKAEKPTEGTGWSLANDRRVTEFKANGFPAALYGFVRANAETGAIELTLGNPESKLGLPSGHTVTVKKIDSTVNKVTIKLEGGGKIDGKSSYVLEKQYEAVTLCWVGGNAEIIGLVGPELPL